MITSHLMFTLYLWTGIIKPTDKVDGRPIYSMPSAKIEYAYKGELVNYISTGKFIYNEDL